MIKQLYLKFEKSLIKFRRYHYKKVHQRIIKQNVKNKEIYLGSKEEYEKNVLPFWEKYGLKPDIRWFQYYGYVNQKFDPHIIPADLYYTDIYYSLNDSRYDDVLDNKFFSEYFVKGIKKAHTIVKYGNGLFLTDDFELITKEEALEIINKYGKVLIKPTDTGQGKGIELLDFNKNYDEAVKSFEEKISDGDFIVQELIKQSDQLARFNSSSVNTIRVISLIVDNKVEILSKILRVGSKGSFIDNYSQGGMSRPIDDEGVLKTYAFVKENKVYVDNEGNQLTEEKIIGYDKIIEEIKKYHKRIPHLRMIGWDFAIDQDYEPVFIEYNGYVGENQREDGPAFNKFTEKVLDYYYDKKNNKK